MKSIPCALVPGGPHRLVLRWEGAYDDVGLTLDGRDLEEVEAPREDARSHTFLDRESGGTLTVDVFRSTVGGGLRILKDGHPLPWVPGSPEFLLQRVVWVFRCLAAFNLALSAYFWSFELADAAGHTTIPRWWYTTTVAIALNLFFLGEFTGNQKRWAFHFGFWLVAGVYLLDSVLAATITLDPLLFVASYIRAWVLAMLWPGFRAFRDLRSRPLPAVLLP